MSGLIGKYERVLKTHSNSKEIMKIISKRVHNMNLHRLMQEFRTMST